MIAHRASSARRVVLAAATMALLGGLVPPAPAATPVERSAMTVPASEPGAADAGAFTPDPVRWRRCRKASLRDLGLQCSSLRVPLDHADAQGPTIRLALSRLRHASSATDYRGVLLTNPGGPGASGLTLPAIAGDLPGGAGRRWDWIGIDPRGVGASRPRLVCPLPPRSERFQGKTRSYRPDRRNDVNWWLARTLEYTQTCDDDASAVLLPHMGTEDLADDLDLVRRALGQEQVGFYGFSYGSLLGQVYATRYPARVKAMILDSNLDATQTVADRADARERALSESQDEFFRYLARNNRRFAFGGSARVVRREYQALVKRQERRPTRGFGPTDLTNAVIQTQYAVALWPAVAEGMARLKYRRNPGLLRRVLSSPGRDDGNSGAAFYATACTDGAPPEGYEQLRRRFRVIDRSQVLSWSQIWGEAPCLSWPQPAGPLPVVDGSLVPVPVLLLTNSDDAITPPAWTEATKAEFPTSSYVLVAGAFSHIASTNGNRCADRAVARYLRTLAVPPRRSDSGPDRVCQGTRPLEELGGRRSAARLVPAPVLTPPQPAR